MRVDIGHMYVVRSDDGTITIGDTRRKPFGQFSLGEAKIPTLSRDDIDDLLVALDGVIGEAKNPDEIQIKTAVIGGARTLEREIYKLTASPPLIEITVAEHVFCTLLSSFPVYARRPGLAEIESGSNVRIVCKP